MTASPLGSTVAIAWRNLWRNGRRTGLALGAIGLSVALVLAYDSILRAYGDWLVATLTGPMLGHVQAHAPGWRKDRAPERTLPDATAAIEALRRDPGVAVVRPRVYAPALAALGEEGFGVMVLGVEPDAEGGPAGMLARAKARPEGKRVLVGASLAGNMGVSAGDVIALVGQGVDGSLANDLYTVAELVATPVDLVNRQAVIVELSEARTLFTLGDEVHELAVVGRDPDALPALAARVAAVPALRGAEVLDWRAIAPELVAIVRLVDVAWAFVLVLVLAAAAAGVANTMLMSTFERTRELGMLLALGAGPGRIVGLVLVEAVALGLTGALAGTALGLGLVAATHGGIDWATITGGGPSEISFGGLVWSLRLYPKLAAIDVVRVLAGVLVVSVLAAAWPAARAARLQPARALRE